VPTGWNVGLSQSTGEVYYFNEATGESQYDPPATSAPRHPEAQTPEAPSPPVASRWEPPPFNPAGRREDAPQAADLGSTQVGESMPGSVGDLLDAAWSSGLVAAPDAAPNDWATSPEVASIGNLLDL
jgi:hypothetical protein